MPAPDEGEWTNWCSNVVCVRTKSSKDSENTDDVPVVSIQPTVVRSVYRSEPSLVPLPQPPRPIQHRRITRLIEILPPPVTPIHYEGISKILLNLKTPITTPVYNGPDFSSLLVSPPRRSVAVKTSFEPKLSYDLSEATLPPTYGRHFRSFSLAPIVRRSTSVPSVLATPSLLRSSISAPRYSAYSSGFTGSHAWTTGSVTSPLRSGSFDVSYLTWIPQSYQIISRALPSVPSPATRSIYHRVSRPVPRADRLTYRSSGSTAAGSLREEEEEFKSYPLTSSSDLFSWLRSRTQQVRDKLNTHRSLIDRYLLGSPSAESSFTYRNNRNYELESFSSRPSFSPLPRMAYTGSRTPLMESSDVISASRTLPHLPPFTPTMSEARRRIRGVLYKVSGDQEYMN